MKKIAFYIGFFLLLGPHFALAQTTPCSSRGYTVIFVNGVFDTYQQALDDSNALKVKLLTVSYPEPVTVRLGYNPTHLAGAGDLAQSLAQYFSYSVSDYDLQTILMQIYPEVTTRKLLLVGHSQGAYYADEMYNYLLAHGEPKEAVDVYEVSTPAPKAASSGKYLNSSSDLVLTYLHETLHFSVLPSNIDIPLLGDDIKSSWPGHSFVDAYLAGASDRITSDITGELLTLVPTYSTNTGGCFTPPDVGLGYKTQRVIFAVADPTAVVVKAGTVAVVTGAFVIGNTGLHAVATVFNFLSNVLPAFSVSVTDNSHTEKNFTVMKKLYGSSLDINDVKELLGDSQGGAVALALPKEKPIPVNGGFVEGTSTDSPQANTSNVSTTTLLTVTPFILAPPPPTYLASGGSSSDFEPTVPDTATEATTTGKSATSTSETLDATTTPDTSSDTNASSTPEISATSTPGTTLSRGSIIASQTDSSGTPSHYWHSDGSSGAFLVLDPNGGAPGYSIGIIATTTSTIAGIHIKVQFNSSGMFNQLPRIPILFDESGNTPLACALVPFGGFAYGSAADARSLQNPLQWSDFNGKMIDMYFQCGVGVGNGGEQVYANTSYRLFFYPVSIADVNDIYVAMNAAGTEPYYEISGDGTY